MRLAEFSELIGLFYEAVADSDRWNDFLGELCRRFECDKAGITFHDPQNQHPALGFSVGIPPDAVRAFNTHYAKLNPAAPIGTRAAMRSGAWQSLNQVTQYPDWRNNEYYVDFQRPHGMFYAAMGAVRSDSRHLTTLNLTRPESAGALGQDAAQLITLFLPHLKRSFQIQKKLETLRTVAEGEKEVLNRWDTGLVAVDGNSRMVLANTAAEAILKAQQVLTVSQGKIVATNPSQVQQLEELIKSAAMTGAGLGTAGGGALLLQGKDSNSLSIVVTPFHSGSLFIEDHLCALLFISDPAAKPASRMAILRRLFALTPAECRLAALLFEGLEINTAAEQMHVTAGTVRFMLKQVFHKTSTHRQSQLIRLMSLLPGEPRPARS